MNDSKIKQWLKWAILGTGRTGRNVSQGLGHAPNYLHERLAVQEIVTKEFLDTVLGELGYALSDFFACMEGRLGDPRIHLARIQDTAEASPVWPSVFPPAKRRKGAKKPPFDIWELDSKRFEISLRRTARYAGWYACYGETEAERCEGWAVLGIVQRQQRRLRHAAYCFLKALELCEEDSRERALTYRRMSYVLGEVREFELAQACLRHSLDILLVRGDLEFVGRVLLDLSFSGIQRGLFSEAARHAQCAINFTSDPWHLFAAQQFAGLCFLELGQTTEAIQMAEYCRASKRNDREVFYGQYLYARCLVRLEQWDEAIDSLQRATNVASYDGIFLGDQLELELVNIRCHLEVLDYKGAYLGIERFRRVALLVSREFTNAYTWQLEKMIKRRDVKAVLELQTSLLKHFKEHRQSV